MFKTCALSLALLLVSASSLFAQSHQHQSATAKISVVFDQPIPNIPGKSMKGVLVEYGPGGSSPAHTHAKSAFIYATVLEGAIRSQVNGGEIRVFKKGENFAERPGDHHGVSANASDTEPAKLLAVFVVDTNDTELTTPIK
jgi:quercetin dioxygenase-like cupin family protein